MFRGLVLCSLISLFTIPSAAQFGDEERRASALGNTNQQFPTSVGSRLLDRVRSAHLRSTSAGATQSKATL